MFDVVFRYRLGIFCVNILPHRTVLIETTRVSEHSNKKPVLLQHLSTRSTKFLEQAASLRVELISAVAPINLKNTSLSCKIHADPLALVGQLANCTSDLLGRTHA